ncbi:MAG: exo-rhamnogalacturonan lyase family protein [Thermoguttaceae bacterium]
MRCGALVVGVFVLLMQTALGGSVPLGVEEPSGVARCQWPVTSGVPLAAGQLRDASQTTLLTAQGEPVPLQTEILARWPDGSVRWLLLDFQVDLAAKEKKRFELRYGPGTAPAPVPNPIRVDRSKGEIALNTGPLRLGKGVWLDVDGDGSFSSSEQLADHRPSFVLTDADGTQFTDSTPEVALEQSGPIRACLRLSGEFASGDKKLFRYVARIHAYRGQPWVRVCHTFINDCPDSLMTKIRSLELVVRPSWRPDAAAKVVLDGKAGAGGRLLQVDERQYQLDGQQAGQRGCGWAAISSVKAGMAIGLREFWQNWPKSVEARPEELRIGLCPTFPAGLYDGHPLMEENKLYYALRGGVHTFKVGVARTHEMWANFFTGQAESAKLAEFFHAAEDPLLATAEPRYISATRAMGDFPPTDPADPDKFCGYDAWLSRALDAHLVRRDKDREYGMLNYGDWYGERTVNWGNLEYDLQHGLLLQYVRTGDRKFFLRGEEAARHHIDVDVVHATNGHLKNPWGEQPQVGDIWLHACNHTGGYYENAPLPVDRTYQMGHSTNFGHVWVAGDLEYYYLTGDRRALDVSIEIADAMARHCPTSYGTHIRNLGWPMVLLLAAYEATGDKSYLEATDKEWEVLKKNIEWEQGWVVKLASDHCAHGDRRCYGNVPFMEGLTLSALARYHRFTRNPEVLRAITVGIDQMIRECWQEDKKVLRYTACPKIGDAPMALCLAAEAIAYEVSLTGNREHLRILREGVPAALPKGSGGDIGKSMAQFIHFAPYALTALDENQPTGRETKSPPQ